MMKLLALLPLGLVVLGGASALLSSQSSTPSRPAVNPFKRSEVVFMYQAEAATYAQYGATALGWGGTPSAKALEAARGVRFFGSVGMVTEFSRYYERFPTNYEEGLCRDINGQPVKVPWLTDHQHNGIPFWWCCTQQPLFRQYLRERVAQTVKAGADGVHIDDHMGTSGGLWLGTCFCDRCVAAFSSYLKAIPAGELAGLQVTDPDKFNFREVVRAWLAAPGNSGKKPTQHPLWNRWTIYQCKAAAAFMQELRELAAATAGRAMPMGANAGLLWPRHLVDYRTLDLFSAETDHHAGDKRFSDVPLLAYRLADAVKRPYAATASGGDWAFIKEQDRPGLVRGWVALSYAAGHYLMVPHRQWCYTPQKGTHWYQGPAEKFVPLYRFVRDNAPLFDGYENYADLAVVFPYKGFSRDPGRWTRLCAQLAATNLSFQLLLAGDEIVEHPLNPAELEAAREILVTDTNNLLPADLGLLLRQPGLAGTAQNKRYFQDLPAALANVRPAVTIEANLPVRALPRVKPGSAVIHLLNYAYEFAADDVRPLNAVRVRVEGAKLGLPRVSACTLFSAGSEPIRLEIQDGMVEVPTLGLWGILKLE